MSPLVTDGWISRLRNVPFSLELETGSNTSDFLTDCRTGYRPLARLWEYSQSGGQNNKIFFYKSDNFFCFVLQIDYIPTDVQGVYRDSVT